MMTTLPLVTIVHWMITMTLIHGQSYYLWKKGNDEKKDFIEYPGLWLVGTILGTFKGTNSECLNACKKTLHCRAVNIDPTKNYCEFHSVTTGEFKKYSHTIFFSSQENQCTSYCDEFDYMNICGQCQCVDLCNSMSPFYCDCSDAVPASPMCTKVITDDDRNVSGIYKVNFDPSPLKLMCQQTSEIPNGELWLTVFRRMGFNQSLERSLDIYRVGYNEPYGDNYFIGYNKLVEFTKNGDVTLRVELMNDKGEEFSIEYKEFVFQEVSEGGSFKGYTFSYKKANTLSCMNNFYEETKEEVDTTCNYYHLLRNCSSKGNALGLGERSYQRITFMLSFETTLKMDDDDVITEENGKFEIPNSDSLEYCIQFEFQMTFVKDGRNQRTIIDISPQIMEFVIDKEGYPKFYIGKNKETFETEHIPNKWHQVQVHRYLTPDDVLKTVLYFDGKRANRDIVEKTPYKFKNTVARIYNEPSVVMGNLRNFYVNGKKMKLA